MAEATSDGKLARGIRLRSATALNMIDMIGVGPFITIPLIIQAMGGPQAMLGWIIGAGVALCDGLIWAELGAALPGQGGTYHYLSEVFGPERWGKFWSFLFVWQLIFAAPLVIASGAIGSALYASFFWPGLDQTLFHVGSYLTISHATLVAMGAVLVSLWLAYRQIRWISRLSQWLWMGALFTLGWVIFAGVTHFNAHLAFNFPPHAFGFGAGFFLGLGSAMVIAFYDYSGYENSNYLAEEVVRPEWTLPRAIIISILLVATLDIVMNISVLGVVPWREMLPGAHSVQNFVISEFMRRIYGSLAAQIVTALILWTAFASVFSLMLGYSRVLYAAAEGGNFFRSFAKLHPRGGFPWVSLLVLGLVSAAFCVFRLDQVIAALVAIRLLFQYLLQAIALIVLRSKRKKTSVAMPFRMWLYPLPVVVALAGYFFLLFAPHGAVLLLAEGGVVMAAGAILFLIRAQRNREWPFARPLPEPKSVSF